MSLLLALHVLDRQLVSADGVLCGKVDDIELAPEDGSLRTAAVLSGSAAWPDRLPAPLRGPAAALFKGDVARAEWDEIAEISAVVRLKLPAAEVGRRRAALAGRARLAHLLGASVVGADGRGRGRVYEVEAGGPPRGVRGPADHRPPGRPPWPASPAGPAVPVVALRTHHLERGRRVVRPDRSASVLIRDC